ncbi:MAG: hypothetical protein M0Z65_07805 [Firmicutes bacterium]|nr:hypothetical protein [Bacillota bacterium]
MKKQQAANQVREEFPVPAGIIPHFLLKKKKRGTRLSQASTDNKLQ